MGAGEAREAGGDFCFELDPELAAKAAGAGCVLGVALAATVGVWDPALTAFVPFSALPLSLAGGAAVPADLLGMRDLLWLAGLLVLEPATAGTVAAPSFMISAFGNFETGAEDRLSFAVESFAFKLDIGGTSPDLPASELLGYLIALIFAVISSKSDAGVVLCRMGPEGVRGLFVTSGLLEGLL